MNQKNYGLLNNEQAGYLLKLPKKILSDKDTVNSYTINQNFPFNIRLELLSTDDEFTFLWVITQSTKSTIRISLHVQDNDSNIGLLRIDFNNGHKNPETISDTLPLQFHAYVGREFSKNDHHIHYHVDGYKSLAWAIPLTDDSFKIKNLDETDFNICLANIVYLFAQTINVETKITINPLLI